MRSVLKRRRSGECRLRGLGHPVQFEVEFRAAFAQPDYLGFQFAYSAAQPGDLKRERLLTRRSDVTHEGACHMATLRFPYVIHVERVVPTSRGPMPLV